MFASRQFIANPVQYGTMARCLCLLLLCFIVASAVRAGAPVPLVGAKAAILMDAATGAVLWEQNADWRLPMASTTKIMTAMVILDHGADKLDDVVTVSQQADDVEGSSLFGAGDMLTLRDLLKGALIRSSNEATIAAAEYLTPSHTVAEFVGWMNDKAEELGLRSTHFANTHGLYTPQHYSSARDLAIMARYALREYPLIRQIVKTRLIQAKVLNRGGVVLENRNKLLGKCVPGIPEAVFDGMKTGYVNESGDCLVSSASLNGWQLIGVVLNSPALWNDTKSLLHYGFARYEWRTYAEAEQVVDLLRVAPGGARPQVPVGIKRALGAPVLKVAFGGNAQEQPVFVPNGARLRAPVSAGIEVGKLSIMRNGVAVASQPVVTLANVPVAGWVGAVRATGYTLLALVVLLFGGRLYGTRAKVARRRRRMLEAQRREAHPRGPGGGQW